MFQQIIIVGNIGRDPEMRYTPSGVPVTNFSVAVNRTWTGQDGQRQEKTTWFRVTAWRRDAELASQYLSKGRQVMVLGEIEEPDVWQDREGNNRATLEVTARQIRFIGSRADANMGGADSGGFPGGPADADPTDPAGGGGSESPADDAIPF